MTHHRFAHSLPSFFIDHDAPSNRHFRRPGSYPTWPVTQASYWGSNQRKVLGAVPRVLQRLYGHVFS